MGRETNIHSIPALDERIKEITAELTRLKRSRNSLLSIARVPPEILGHIFRFNIVPEVGDGRFATVRGDAYNFLLVCHHRSEVARHTPELWSFWGNNLNDWKRRYPLSRAASVDLVLDRVMYRAGSFDGALWDVLKDCAARDAIRKVHIRALDGDLTVNAIVSSLTPEAEVRHSGIESIYLYNVDVSDFFARHHFPKLRDLHLFRNFNISSWGYLKSHTTALVNLSLNFNHATPPSAIPTTSQLLSLLASNPNIRSLMLKQLVISDDSGNGSTSPVPLRHLERFSMTGKFHHVFPILHRLELPERIDKAELEFHECNLEEAHETVAPYIRDYLRRDPRFEGRLGVLSSSTTGCFVLQACTIGVEHHPLDHMPPQNSPYVTFRVAIPNATSPEEREELCIDTLALLPQESVVYLQVDLLILGMEEIISKMPNIEYLHLVDMIVWEGFLLPGPGEPNSYHKLLPSLRGLCLENVEALDEDWGPLVTYMTHQTSGNQVVSLNVFGDGVHICADVLDQLHSLVEWITYIADPDKECSSNDDICMPSLYL